MSDSGEAVPVGQMSYTEASRELDAIVDFFEQREVDVDVLVARLERATLSSLTSWTGACVRPGPKSRSWCPGWTRWPPRKP